MVTVNGWVANDRSLIASYSVPGGVVTLRKGDISVIFINLINRFHSEVEALKWPGIWGYAERLVRGSTTVTSFHAGGLAVDLNAPKHPLGKRGTFSSSQVKAIRNLLSFYEGGIRWGGDYKSRADEMHFEWIGNATLAKRIADKIRGVSAAIEALPAKNVYIPTRPADSLPVLRLGSQGNWVKLMQKGLNFKGKEVDGDMGAGTVRALKAHQSASKIGNDGVCGDLSWASIISRWGTLQQGSNNPGVEIVQNFVGLRGIDCDSDFGPGTKSRVQSVQKYYGIPTHGVVDDTTRRAFAKLIEPSV